LCGGRKTAAGEGFARNGRQHKESPAILTAMSQLEPILTPVVEAAGYRLVRLRLLSGKRKTLQIMAERADGLMDVDDCTKLSRALSEYLDGHEDVIEGEYTLEVSSPGIDRPLTRLTDYARWSGHDARLELVAPDASGRKRFKGKLLGLEGSDVALDVDGTRVCLPFGAIAEAKLVLTDALILEDLKARKAQA
jgi:ribosome maturation factor RimP